MLFQDLLGNFAFLMIQIQIVLVGAVFEPCHEKTNILVSDLVQHKPGCAATEDG